MNNWKKWIFLLIFTVKLFGATSAPLLQINDTINPGTENYITSQIKLASTSGADFLVIQLDTPGGLLNSTRKIVQSMLNSPIPIVVWIGPKGAQAGSAGALITYAADVAAMASGTNIGAAHPVDSSGKSLDKTANDKITNDTAAFAESLSKAKGRNSEWVKESVFSSKSITAEDAVSLKVVDFKADDQFELEEKLRGFNLRSKKGLVTALPNSPHQLELKPATVKQKVVSFFANPSLAYLILSLGGLCVWIELSHPGLIFPGVVGGLSILISLVSFQLLPIRMGALGMILLGIALLIAEMYITSYGVLGIGGILAFILGSLYLMDTNVPEFQISLSIIIPVATCLAFFVFILGYFIVKSRRRSIQDGYQSLIGLTTDAESDISSQSGNVFVHGELWSARSLGGTMITKGSKVEIKEIRGLQLFVQKKENNT